MGIIRAVASSAMDVAGEQWKEFFYCDSLPENILLVRGKKHISEHSANNRMDDGVITNGSIIAVADGQGAIAVSQGKVIAEYSEPGEHIFEDPYHPGGVKGFLKETGSRISFGGGVQTVQQRIYYFNTKEIMGIRFEGNVPVNLHSGDFQSNLSLSGVFSYRVCDPMVFYKMVTGNVAMQYDRSRLNGMLISELKTALAMAVSKTGLFRTSDLGLHTDDLITELKAVLGPMWKEKRGLELVRIAFDGGDFSAADAISDIQMTEVFAEPGTRMQQDHGNPEDGKPQTGQNPEEKIDQEWTCSCGAVSKGNFCPECGAKRSTEWTCSCGAKNAGKFCTNCGKAAKAVFSTAFLVLLVGMLLMMSSPAEAKTRSFKYEYGVFLGANTEDIPRMKDYRIIVVDAMYFSKKQVKQLKKQGHVVYSYLNIGSIETFRSYFEEFEPYTLDPYAHWYDEYWIDVSQKKWQDRIIEEAAKLKKKGVDGLFVDNTDVYYYYHTDEIYQGLTVMLKAFRKQGHYVFLNSGDNYVKEYLRHHKKLDIIDGVNEETVFSRIQWDEGTFGKNGAEEKKFFQDYCALVQKKGGDVYLLEYTADKDLKKKIRKYCKKKGYKYYITDDLDLGAGD